MLTLAIETSCDETAASIVDATHRRILSNVLYSQIKEHAAYQGVIPEVASRAHLERLPHLVEEALTQANLQPTQLDALAATTGPGLTTALLMGSTFAKTMALALGKPFLATNHIEGHALSPHLTDPNLTFPYLLLLVSGGHTQIVMVHQPGHYEMLGTTVDDAAGECFDKVGKLLGLPHPAGPAIEQLAKQGNPTTLQLPFPKNDASLDFSFSGLKTAMRDLISSLPHEAVMPAQAGTHGINQRSVPSSADIAASFQHRVSTIFAKKCGNALAQTKAPTLVAAGGVAANSAIRSALAETCAQHGATFSAPPPHLCTDNAAMIAYAAGLRHLHRLPTGTLATPVRPRWPLAEVTAA
ncbi:MAG: tRNA (adenosine(37)-N6)-threonylcarbamoyltransferase complex transferase subunit TsaD [Pseudomonadaceae bacterium]|nr:tRNA (adenosine(37)-N6)-threonylcarbamoyltransferase complex transferase subunit TsaD [Pseudomonadaceae bacterium]